MTYFLTGLIIETWVGTIDRTTLMHHLIIISSAIQFYWNPYGGFESMVVLFVGEVSNPFLTLRTFLKLRGAKGTRLYFMNDIAFISVFLPV